MHNISRKRNDVTFTAADFYRIKGSPSFDDGNTQASIYALISDVGILSANDLLTVMTNAQNSIESDLGQLSSTFNYLLLYRIPQISFSPDYSQINHFSGK